LNFVINFTRISIEIQSVANSEDTSSSSSGSSGSHSSSSHKIDCRSKSDDLTLTKSDKEEEKKCSDDRENLNLCGQTLDVNLLDVRENSSTLLVTGKIRLDFIYLLTFLRTKVM
jgi:hypothetical protein